MLPGTEPVLVGEVTRVDCCGAFWIFTGERIVHCLDCHETFLGDSAEVHRKAGHCYAPREVGLIPALKAFPAWMKGPR